MSTSLHEEGLPVSDSAGGGRICRLALVCAAGVFAAISAQGATYCFTNSQGDGDWSNVANFVQDREPTGDPATELPGSEDEVFLVENATVTFEYDTSDAAKLASCQAFAAIRHIRPASGSVIDITVPEGAVFALSCGISRGKTESNYNVGHIIKRGAGELDLNAAGYVVSGGEYYDYYCAITVAEGILRLPQSGISDHFHVGATVVNPDGTLFTAASGSSYSTTFFSLDGEGTLTNDYSSTCRMEIKSRSEFYGRITGNILYYSSGWLSLYGTESTAPKSNSSFTVYQNYGHGVADSRYGCVEVAKFGTKAVEGVCTPSSIGYSESLLTRDNGGGFRYLGTGETTDKDLRLWPQTTDYPTYLDGGPHGGLVWTGLWGQRDQELRYIKPSMLRLVIQGSNTEECVMSGPIQFIAKNDTNYTFCITKAGTGTWRMVHNDESDMRGTWRIVNGTLRYDTIAEAGVNSALGRSSVLYANVCGLAKDENKVDYAFWLGGGTDGDRANLEYVGETNCVSTTRLFALNGTGGILNNGKGYLQLAGFYAPQTASTLVLGGTNSCDNVVHGVADGEGGVSVVKEGSGTWYLGTNCTFTGSLDVKAGTLTVGNPCYEYYRWTIRATYNPTGGSSTERIVGLRSFGLFDSDGNDRVFCLSHEGDWYSYGTKEYYCSYPYSYLNEVFENDAKTLDIDKGHFRITKYDGTFKYFTTGGHEAVSNLFAHADFKPNFWSRNPQMPPVYTNDETWITVTMRPVDGAPITSWDYVNTYYSKSYQMISNCLLEASMDGLSWDLLQEVTNDTQPTGNMWQSDNTTSYEVGYTTHTTGMPIPAGPTNDVVFTASSVSVANGATLRAGAAATRPVISKLVLDGTEGGGTIDGFAFASNCTLEITNAPSKPGYTVPLTLANESGTEDVSGWTLKIDGKVKAGRRFTVTGSGVEIAARGLILVIQ